MASSTLRFDELLKILDSEFSPLQVEVSPFLIGWYNKLVDENFKLNFDENTLAFVTISTPKAFGKSILPYLLSHPYDMSNPVDTCFREVNDKIRSKYPNLPSFEAFSDSDLDHHHRPRVLVQTAGHVAGAAYYYQQNDVLNPPWPNTKKMFGVSVHPMYGGWFAFRCVLIFKDVKCPELTRVNPVDCVPGNQQRIELLKRFNYSWQDWSYRDIIPVVEKYSDKEKEYFGTEPDKRKYLVLLWQEEK